MDIKSGKGYPAGALSNFARHTFVVDGVECNSLEGFLQGLKFKSPDMQREVCTMWGAKAKKAGSKKNWTKHQVLWWQGEEIKRDSSRYQELLDQAFEACYTQNEGAKKALLATGSATLKHSIGRKKINETVLTQREFCSRLTSLRDKLNES